MIELPRDVAFGEVREQLDDLLRANVEKIGPYHLDSDDEPTDPVSHPILGDWVVLTHWMDQEGEHHYVRICSKGLSPHARMGLYAMFDED